MPTNPVSRRTAFQALATMVAAFGGGTVEGQEPKSWQSIRLLDPKAPVGLFISLSQWTHIDVTFNGETIRIDPAEMFRALKEPR